MKKLISIALALVLVFSLATVAMATTNQDPTFYKAYVLKNEQTKSPEETFNFTFTATRFDGYVTGETLTKEEMPEITASIDYEAGGAAVGTVEAIRRKVELELSAVVWPYIGEYYYTVAEEAGTTAGVHYSDAVANMKVTVVRSTDAVTDTNKNYVAYITFEALDDANKTKSGTWTNEYYAGTLELKKTVSGDMADTEREYTFKVTFTNDTGKTISLPITYGENGEANFVNNVAVVENIKLTNNGTITFKNIPEGVNYTIEEIDADGYTKTWTGDATKDTDDQDKADGEITGCEDDHVVCNNEKDADIDMGVSLDSLPYILLIVVAVMGIALVATKKQTREF